MFLRPQDVIGQQVEADTIVVGAGAAGIAIARTLHERGHDVLLVEGGGLQVEESCQRLFTIDSVGAPMDGAGRYRVFGGTTVAWTGRCAPLDRIDLEERAWVPGSGWPITLEDLWRYYSRAAGLIGFPNGWPEEPDWFEALKADSDHPDTVEPYLWRLFSVKSRTFRHFGRALQAAARTSGSPRVLVEADLVGLVPDPATRSICEARFLARDGTIVRGKARTWILCCGGIENARLLLNAAEQSPASFAATSASLGRYFMQHPRTVTANIRTSAAQANALQMRFNLFRRRGLHFEAGLALPEEAQRRLKLLNASAVLRYFVGSIWSRPDRMTRRFKSMISGTTPILHKPEVSVVVDVEQIPDVDSRIFLSPERDRLGLRKAAIDWRINTMERRTSAVLTEGVGSWITRLGLGEMETIEGLSETGGLTPEYLRASYHHIGATRMSQSAATGVVDANLRMHGISNLYMCGASVMPTGGHANPTLTIVALALRLADHVAQKAELHQDVRIATG